MARLRRVNDQLNLAVYTNEIAPTSPAAVVRDSVFRDTGHRLSEQARNCHLTVGISVWWGLYEAERFEVVGEGKLCASGQGKFLSRDGNSEAMGDSILTSLGT
jgi:hypothetical protein